MRIDHRLPEPGRGSRAAFRITTRERLLKRFAHAISDRTKRGGYVDMDAANRPDVIAILRQLGFRNAPRLSGFSPLGAPFAPGRYGPALTSEGELPSDAP